MVFGSGNEIEIAVDDGIWGLRSKLSFWTGIEVGVGIRIRFQHKGQVRIRFWNEVDEACRCPGQGRVLGPGSFWVLGPRLRLGFNARVRVGLGFGMGAEVRFQDRN